MSSNVHHCPAHVHFSHTHAPALQKFKLPSIRHVGSTISTSGFAGSRSARDGGSTNGAGELQPNVMTTATTTNKTFFMTPLQSEQLQLFAWSTQLAPGHICFRQLPAHLGQINAIGPPFACGQWIGRTNRFSYGLRIAICPNRFRDYRRKLFTPLHVEIFPNKWACIPPSARNTSRRRFLAT